MSRSAAVPRLGLGLALTLALLACGDAHRERSAAAPAVDPGFAGVLREPANWASYGRDHTNQRWSPLAQVNTGNVRSLRPAWIYHTGIAEAFEASPVVVDGTMYISTPLDHVVALDARTGAKRWEYVPRLGTTVHCCGPVNRGVAVYGGRVYLGTLDARLVALDAGTGKVAWETRVADNERGYSETAAPVAADGKVMIGISGAEYGIRGFLSAYDAATGKLIWRFHTIPSPEEGGWWGGWSATDPFGTPLNRDIARERADSALYADAWRTGGGSVWQAPTVDEARGLVIFNVGNASPDLDGTPRPGDNLYTNSIVAVELKTGKLRWYFQEVPHDTWDFDAASPVVLAEVRDGRGEVVPAAVQAGKTGWVYVVDRTTGRPIRRSEAFVPQANIFARPTQEGVRMLPGANGGSEWSPPAYSPQTGYLYVLGLHQPMLYKAKRELLRPPAFWLGGLFLPTGEPQHGLFTAVDLNTGKIAWQRQVPDPMIGGALATAGGLVFVGTADKRFLAFDARSGAPLWSYAAEAGVNAPPISYAVDGTQYIAVAAGGNYQIDAPRGDAVIAFRLGDAPAPAPADTAAAAVAPATRARPRF